MRGLWAGLWAGAVDGQEPGQQRESRTDARRRCRQRTGAGRARRPLAGGGAGLGSGPPVGEPREPVGELESLEKKVLAPDVPVLWFCNRWGR